MNFTAAEINAWVGSFLWPLFRIGAVVATMPVLGARYIPKRIKIFFALTLTLVIAPTIPHVPAVDPLSVQAIGMIIQQLVIGAATGLLMAMVFGAFVIGGEIIASEMGLGFASIIDPQLGVQVPVVSQLYVILVSLVFVTLNGHLMLINELALSFKAYPIDAHALDRDTFWQIVTWAGEMFKGAVLMALPAVTTLLIVNVALGIIMRAAPQFNILSVGFPVTVVVGLLVMLITLPLIIAHFQQLMEGSHGVLLRILSGGP